ncbi:MAG: hypothetical protein V1858_03515 [Candidatus Gottesmanbacteria bacterium]
MKLKSLSKKISAIKLALRKKYDNNRKLIIIGLILFLLATGLYNFKGLFVAAMVNGQPIWRISVDQELEKQAGSKILDSLITKQLVLQEAGKQKANISDQEINQGLKDLEDSLTKQGQNLDELLTAQGMSRNDIKDQIKLQKQVEKMVAKDIKVTDADVQKYYDDNQETLYQDKKFADVKAEIQKQLEQEKLNEKIQTWVEDLRKKAKINYFTQF